MNQEVNEWTVNLLAKNSSKAWILARAFHPGTLSTTPVLFYHDCLFVALSLGQTLMHVFNLGCIIALRP